MRIIAEVIGCIVLLGLIGLGVGWIIDNVEVRKAGGRIWATMASALRGNNTTPTNE